MPHVAEMLEAEIDISPMMPAFFVIDGADEIGSQLKIESSLKSASSRSCGSSTR